MATFHPQRALQGDAYPKVPQAIEVPPGESLRFAVGSKTGLHSAVWWLKAHDNGEVYVSFRNAKYFKVSLHQSGLWRAGFTQEAEEFLMVSGDRAINKFKPPADFSPGAKRALSIIIPMTSLHSNPETKLPPAKKPVSWWPVVRRDEAICFDIIIVESGVIDLGRVVLTQLGVVGRCILANGVTIFVSAAVLATDEQKSWLWQQQFNALSNPSGVYSPTGPIQRVRSGVLEDGVTPYHQQFQVGVVADTPTIIDLGDPRKPALFDEQGGDE